MKTFSICHFSFVIFFIGGQLGPVNSSNLSVTR